MMAFPSRTGSRKSLRTALESVEALASGIKQAAQAMIADSAAGNVTGRAVMQLMEEFSHINDRLNALKTTPGLAEYTQAQYNDAQLDIAAEFTKMQAALVACISWIQTNLPKDAGGRWLAVEEIIDGKRLDRMFAPATTAGLRTVLTTLAATID